MNYVWSTGTHVGLVRESNQDAVHPDSGGSGPGPVLVAVADGMGGHVGGDIASRVAITAAADPAPVGDGGQPTPAARVGEANRAVVETVLDRPELAGMGTTMSLAVIAPGGSTTIAHVGDSRIYLLRDGRLDQLTSDHTLVAELVNAGRIRPEDAATHPHRHMLTRALGTARSVDVDTLEIELSPGDRLLLCSDGLTSMVDAARIEALLRDAGHPEEAVWSLIEAANGAGGLDNTTVVVVEASA